MRPDPLWSRFLRFRPRGVRNSFETPEIMARLTSIGAVSNGACGDAFPSPDKRRPAPVKERLFSPG